MEVPTDNKRFKYSGMSAGPAPKLDLEAMKEHVEAHEKMLKQYRARLKNATFLERYGVRTGELNVIGSGNMCVDSTDKEKLLEWATLNGKLTDKLEKYCETTDNKAF
jgi:hypothetical protein